MEAYEIVGTIGEGTYGVVLKARHLVSGQLVAIKKFKESDSDAGVRKTALREVRLLRVCVGVHIVRMLEAFRRRRKLHIVFELAQRTLLEEMEAATGGATGGGLPPLRVAQAAWQLLRGLAFLHARNVMHRDVKPENILVSANGVLKLCDFGFARGVAGPGAVYTDYVATRWYRPPELLLADASYDAGVDIWAAGCVIAEMATGVPLFPGDSDMDMLAHITAACGALPQRVVETARRNPMFAGVNFTTATGDSLHTRLTSAGVPPLAIDLIASCLRYEPLTRPSAASLLSHAYFNGMEASYMPHFRAAVAADARVNTLGRSVPIRGGGGGGAETGDAGQPASPTSPPNAAAFEVDDVEQHTTPASGRGSGTGDDELESSSQQQARRAAAEAQHVDSILDETVAAVSEALALVDSDAAPAPQSEPLQTQDELEHASGVSSLVDGLERAASGGALRKLDRSMNSGARTATGKRGGNGANVKRPVATPLHSEYKDSKLDDDELEASMQRDGHAGRGRAEPEPLMHAAGTPARPRVSVGAFVSPLHAPPAAHPYTTAGNGGSGRRQPQLEREDSLAQLTRDIDALLAHTRAAPTEAAASPRLAATHTRGGVVAGGAAGRTASSLTVTLPTQGAAYHGPAGGPAHSPLAAAAAAHAAATNALYARIAAGSIDDSSRDAVHPHRSVKAGGGGLTSTATLSDLFGSFNATGGGGVSAGVGPVAGGAGPSVSFGDSHTFGGAPRGLQVAHGHSHRDRSVDSMGSSGTRGTGDRLVLPTPAPTGSLGLSITGAYAGGGESSSIRRSIMSRDRERDRAALQSRGASVLAFGPAPALAPSSSATDLNISITGASVAHSRSHAAAHGGSFNAPAPGGALQTGAAAARAIGARRERERVAVALRETGGAASGVGWGAGGAAAQPQTSHGRAPGPAPGSGVVSLSLAAAALGGGAVGRLGTSMAISRGIGTGVASPLHVPGPGTGGGSHLHSHAHRFAPGAIPALMRAQAMRAAGGGMALTQQVR